VSALGRIGVGEPTFWLPRPSSNLAPGVDLNWAIVYWVSAFFFALVTFLMVWFVLRYRGKSGDTPPPSASHSTPLEVAWSVIPTLIVIGMFWSGYRTYLDMATPPADAYEVRVEGQKWNWLFTYPNGYVDNNLHVEVGRPTVLVMTSKDVIHSLYVPEFRVKRDVMPGRYSKLWFIAVEPGQYDLFCAEYCGKDHSAMLAKVEVHPPGEFDRWLADASDFLKRMSPPEAGALLYNVRGCKQCHSLDGSAGTGPTFRGLWGSEERLADGGSVVVDENYVRESIVAPLARVTAGYEPVMPTYQGRLSDEEIAAIIEYLKTLGEGG
jgi:cytochrome c oxidase subunit 2